MLAIAVLSAVVGAIAGSGATIFTAQQLSKSSSNTGSSLVAPLAPVTNNLTEESAIINVAENAGKAVVEIQTRISSTDTFLQQEQRGIGSGFIVNANGYIVTNNHVVENAAQLQVILRDGTRTFDARVVGTSPEDDIAVLLVSHNLAQVLELAQRVVVLRHGRRVAVLSVAETTREEIVALITGAIDGESPEDGKTGRPLT